MAVGILVTPWIVKPPLGYGVNWGNSLSNGLVEAVLFNEYGNSPYSLLRHTKLIQTGTGQGWSNLNRTYNGSGGIDQIPNISDHQITGALTVAFGMLSTSIASDNSWHELVNRRNVGFPTSCEFGFNFNNNNSGVNCRRQFFWVSGGGFQTISYDVTSEAAGAVLEHWAGTRLIAGTSGKLYINGVQKASGSGLSVAGSTTQPITFGGIADASEPHTGSYSYFYMWNRELTAAEVQQIYSNPYQLIQPKRIFFSTNALAGARIIMPGINVVTGRNF